MKKPREGPSQMEREIKKEGRKERSQRGREAEKERETKERPKMIWGGWREGGATARREKDGRKRSQ